MPNSSNDTSNPGGDIHNQFGSGVLIKKTLGHTVDTVNATKISQQPRQSSWTSGSSLLLDLTGFSCFSGTLEAIASGVAPSRALRLSSRDGTKLTISPAGLVGSTGARTTPHRAYLRASTDQDLHLHDRTPYAIRPTWRSCHVDFPFPPHRQSHASKSSTEPSMRHPCDLSTPFGTSSAETVGAVRRAAVPCESPLPHATGQSLNIPNKVMATDGSQTDGKMDILAGDKEQKTGHRDGQAPSHIASCHSVTVSEALAGLGPAVPPFGFALAIGMIGIIDIIASSKQQTGCRGWLCTGATRA
ncbi:hypothetical protein CONLIGDRAFT_648939 [Coniochaeta ligniaria NRRL 30616]|uniref:Uncharacterized protein n=1 Tax=Coniochaeta ligniaria NRRL 30616 TaxID=1408157 RepID=A0A1J7J2U2_9PEZI|nr:hypothetical protein CONLIGDRAFT_648939 [Coniochaeta ligniaria NRRL 30616]